ncbi:uncharacterized protein IL334_005061 [Kwoniella shivajii]|uniref:Membrane anchor Opy2 N-terminal domain-containing protein n=1 Tax=Kwoniella shivajii TaxID=564305 RepID=A0ABZ1D2K0_9TREE|nr:hypothetical protein IL334_005061 [Kwoniella shivajii]
MHSSHKLNISPRLDSWKRDGCVSCDESTPQCNCSTGEKCILTSRTCNQCAAIQCIKSASSSSKGVNPGAIAGPVVAVLVIASLGLFWWLRRKKRRDLARLEALAARARKAESAGFHLSQPPSPQPGSAHSHSTHSRNSLPQPPPSAARARSPLPPAPVNAEYYDDHGATIRVYNTSRGTIDLDKNNSGDPFSDRQSISTMGSGGTANIIPIQYIPPSNSDEALSKILPVSSNGNGNGNGISNQGAAARALDEARRNLLHPIRPARAPGLDLRLNPPSSNSNHEGGLSPPTAFTHDRRSPIGTGGSSSQCRDSYLSGNSAAPSYWSGQSDVHLDAPKIVTSKQVQIGRLQQAEVVQFGKPSMERLGGGGQLSPIKDENIHPNPFQQQQQSSLLSPAGTFQSGSATMRTLTPSSHSNSRTFDDDDEEGLRSSEPSSAGPGDLRFSMGSLNSVSTMGTGRYLASTTSPNFDRLPPPPLTSNNRTNSIGSSRSFADSVLGAFPMIPPNSEASSAARIIGQTLPQSTSTTTLEHVAVSSSSHPPRPASQKQHQRPYHGQNQSTDDMEDIIPERKKRPDTQASVADSFLGSFPFLPPNREDLAGLPTSNIPSNARTMSTTSEGLAGFDFDLENAPPLPSTAGQRRN